jgi:predicted PolB exonuclease-like 3'-5' exonuclease
LKRHLNLKTRYDLVDYDYLDSLSDKEKEWLNRFTEEYVHANMNHKGKVLHRTKKMKKDCYDRNNSRNRCILTKSKAMGSSVSLIDVTEEPVDENAENNLINKIDLEKRGLKE